MARKDKGYCGTKLGCSSRMVYAYNFELSKILDVIISAILMYVEL